VCAYLLIIDSLVASSIFIIIIWISDLLDGYLARKRNEISELGKILDPLADKFAVIIISLIMVFKEFIPIWFFLVIVIRDILIICGGIYLKIKTHVVLQSNQVGKAAVFFIGLTILMFLLKKIEYIVFSSYHNEFTELLLSILVFVSLVVTVFSIISYLNRFVNILKKSTN
jgi:CDP-diacylglycerol--glycerol-3-phosphate 3-phosphatidyltransferase